MAAPFISDPRPTEDLTTKARIRDAALIEFAEKGFRGATMRGIASVAGVSLGLVQHHFSTKDGLRAACDERVMQLVRLKTDALDDGTIGDPEVMGALVSMAPAVQRYLGRAVVDGSTQMAELLDRVRAASEVFLTTRWPDRFVAGSRRTRDAAAVMTAISSSTMVLQAHLARWMEVEPWSETALRRTGVATFDVLETLGDLMASDLGRQMRAAVDTDLHDDEE